MRNLALTDHFFVQYGDWIVNCISGELGEISFFLHESVTEAIAEYFGPTINLAILAQLIALVLSVPLGILAAYKRGSATDVVAVSVSLLGIAIPGFLLSMFLMLFFSVYHHWFPVAGYSPFGKIGLLEHLENICLFQHSHLELYSRLYYTNDKIITS